MDEGWVQKHTVFYLWLGFLFVLTINCVLWLRLYSTVGELMALKKAFRQSL